MTAIQDAPVVQLHPQDGRSFSVERFHEAPQHYLKAGTCDVFSDGFLLGWGEGIACICLR